MNSLTGPLLIDFQNLKATQQQKQYHKQVYSSIKLSLQDMQQYKEIDHFNICQKCNMILTKQDKRGLYDWEEIQSNPSQFKEVIEVCEKEKDQVVVWICTFCEKINVIERGQLRLSEPNTRLILNKGQQKVDLKKDDPILLIVFDISGSMEQIIESTETINPTFQDYIKKTNIYRKICEQQQFEIKQIVQKMQGNIVQQQLKYKDYLKKNKLLMGLTEHLITQINNQNKNVSKVKAQRKQYQSKKKEKSQGKKSIGFMFFHSNIILNFGNADQNVIISDNGDTFTAKIQQYKKERVNFENFEELYQLGANYGKSYDCKLKQFDFNNLDYHSSDNCHNQTALGPAIITALGVISQHGAGSSIMVVTDGIGNKGIFDQTQSWTQNLKKLKTKLEQNRCFLNIFECRNLNQIHKQTCLDKFCSANEQSISRKINILLDKYKNEKLITDIKTKLGSSINRNNIIWTNQVYIRSQCDKISYEEDMAKFSQKLFSNKTEYIHPKLISKNLTEKDYNYLFISQAVIKYQNTQTGQQCIFMTYIQQKIIKYEQMKKKNFKNLDNEETLKNIMEYLHLEEQDYDLDNIPLSFVKKTFRNSLSFNKSICNKSLRFQFNTAYIEPEKSKGIFLEDFRKKIQQKAEENEKEEEDFESL